MEVDFWDFKYDFNIDEDEDGDHVKIRVLLTSILRALVNEALRKQKNRKFLSKRLIFKLSKY